MEMGKPVAFFILVIVACTAIIEAYPFQYARPFSGGARSQNYGYRRRHVISGGARSQNYGYRRRPVNQQSGQQQTQDQDRSYNQFFRDQSVMGDANYRPHGDLSFGGATGGDGVGISVGGGERPQVSVGMGAVGGGVGADVQGEGKYYRVKMMS